MHTNTYPIKKVVTKEKVCVDSIIHTEWYAFQHGLKQITTDHFGVTLHWNQGATFVPWANVLYVQEWA